MDVFFCREDSSKGLKKRFFGADGRDSMSLENFSKFIQGEHSAFSSNSILASKECLQQKLQLLEHCKFCLWVRNTAGRYYPLLFSSKTP